MNHEHEWKVGMTVEFVDSISDHLGRRDIRLLETIASIARYIRISGSKYAFSRIDGACLYGNPGTIRPCTREEFEAETARLAEEKERKARDDLTKDARHRRGWECRRRARELTEQCYTMDESKIIAIEAWLDSFPKGGG